MSKSIMTMRCHVCNKWFRVTPETPARIVVKGDEFSVSGVVVTCLHCGSWNHLCLHCRLQIVEVIHDAVYTRWCAGEDGETH